MYAVHIGRVIGRPQSTDPLEFSAVKAENLISTWLVLTVQSWDFYATEEPDLTLQIHQNKA